MAPRCCERAPSTTSNSAFAVLRSNVRFRQLRTSHRVDVTEYLLVSSASVRLDASELDHFAPFVCFVGHEFSEGGRCHRHRLSSQSKKPRFDNRISKGRVDPIVELVDDRHWCVFGRLPHIPARTRRRSGCSAEPPNASRRSLRGRAAYLLGYSLSTKSSEQTLPAPAR